jgi:hypothetical protein
MALGFCGNEISLADILFTDNSENSEIAWIL